MDLHVSDVFSSVDAAKDALNRFILDTDESYLKETSSKRQCSVNCCERSSGRKFAIRCGLLTEGTRRVSKISPHSCDAHTHYTFQQLSSLWYLLPYHRASVNHNREISVAQIRANKKGSWANDISYMAAYWVRETHIAMQQVFVDPEQCKLTPPVGLLCHCNSELTMCSYQLDMSLYECSTATRCDELCGQDMRH